MKRNPAPANIVLCGFAAPWVWEMAFTGKAWFYNVADQFHWEHMGHGMAYSIEISSIFMAFTCDENPS